MMSCRENDATVYRMPEVHTSVVVYSNGLNYSVLFFQVYRHIASC